jgi:hypothetical protein
LDLCVLDHFLGERQLVNVELLLVDLVSLPFVLPFLLHELHCPLFEP